MQDSTKPHILKEVNVFIMLCLWVILHYVIILQAVATFRANHTEACEVSDENKALIFNQVDTFIQRCKDVVEICDCMITFAR